MNKKAEIYQSGNAFQKLAYRKLSEYLDRKKISEYGIPKRGYTPYRHLLPPDSTVEILCSIGIFTWQPNLALKTTKLVIGKELGQILLRPNRAALTCSFASNKILTLQADFLVR